MAVHLEDEARRQQAADHDDGTSRNEVVNSTRDPIDDSAPGASFMLVGMSYPIVAAILALVIGLGIWIARHYGN